MIPRLAALSIAAMAARICSPLSVPEECTSFCIVRSRATTLRLRSDRFKVWPARLAADLVLAMIKSNFADVDARDAIGIVNLEREPSRTPKLGRVRRVDYFERLLYPCSAPVSLCALALFVALQQALPLFAFAQR